MPTSFHDPRTTAIRLYSSAIRAVPADHEAPRGCPTFQALKIDPSRPQPPLKRPRHVTMAFDPFTRALDLIEFQHLSTAEALARLSTPDGLSRQIVHEGLATWGRQAVQHYHDRLVADMAAIGARDVVAVRPWVHQIPASDPRSRTYELCVWGRAYTYRTLDGVVRELRVPTIGHITDKRRSDAEKSIMAYVVAVGSLIDAVAFDRNRGRYIGGVPYPLLTATSSVPGARRPDHVRVLEIGCTDGEVAPLFQGNVEEAEAYFAEHGRTAIQNLFRSSERRPGYECLGCKERNVCDRLPRSAGILGIRDRSRPRRVFTATGGWYHDECAAKEHFRTLRLPVDEARENTSAVRRGKAVHAWLQRLHDRLPRRPCTVDDLPENPGSWKAGPWHLEGAEAQ